MAAKKEDYERVFNKILGTEIKWSKLSIEDLVTLSVLFNEPNLFFEKLGGEAKYSKTKRMLEELVELRDAGIEVLKNVKWKGPLMTLAKRTLLGPEEGEEKEKTEGAPDKKT